MNDNGLVKTTYSNEECAEMLEKTRWSNVFSWQQMLLISSCMSVYKAAKGIVVFKEGDIEHSMSIIAQGSINIIKHDLQGVEKKLATIRAPQSFGEMSLFDGEPRSARAVAATDVIMMTLTKDGFFKLTNEAPQLAVKLLWGISRLLSKRLRKASGDLVEFYETSLDEQ